MDEPRLELAVETAVPALEGKEEDSNPGDLARLVVAVYGLIGKEGSVNAARVRELVRAVGGERR